MIDPAMLRPGRLDKHVYVQLPTSTERFEILNKLTKKTPLEEGIDLEAISRSPQAEGYTGADLSNLVRIASELAIQPFLDKPTGDWKNICVNKKHFETALLQVRPSVSSSEHMEYDQLAISLRNSKKTQLNLK